MTFTNVNSATAYAIAVNAAPRKQSSFAAPWGRKALPAPKAPPGKQAPRGPRVLQAKQGRRDLQSRLHMGNKTKPFGKVKSGRILCSAAFFAHFTVFYVTQPTYILSCRCKSIFYLKIVKIQFEFILCRKTGITQIAAFAFPFFQPAIVKQFQFFIDNKRHDIIFQTLFEKQ